jgi:hypothetical protein
MNPPKASLLRLCSAPLARMPGRGWNANGGPGSPQDRRQTSTPRAAYAFRVLLYVLMTLFQWLSSQALPVFLYSLATEPRGP